MTLWQWFAAVGMPLILVLLGFAAVKLNEWDLYRKRRDREDPNR